MRQRVVVLALGLLVGCARPAQSIEWPKDLYAIPAANKTDASAIFSVVMQALGIQQPLPPVRLVEFRFVPLASAQPTTRPVARVMYCVSRMIPWIGPN
jgi:hypothetical protein